MIYLASPYTHPMQQVVQRRYRQALASVAEHTKLGKVIYSPIVHYHAVAVKYSLPGDFEFWKNINFGMLSKADELYILTLPGWDTSIGVTEEIKFAEEHNIPVTKVKLPHGSDY